MIKRSSGSNISTLESNTSHNAATNRLSVGRGVFRHRTQYRWTSGPPWLEFALSVNSQRPTPRLTLTAELSQHRAARDIQRASLDIYGSLQINNSLTTQQATYTEGPQIQRTSLPRIIVATMNRGNVGHLRIQCCFDHQNK